MLVGVISDSHDSLSMVKKAFSLFREKGVEHVIHLGDIVSPFTLRLIGRLWDKPLTAVYGNNCGDKLTLREVAAKHGYTIQESPRGIELGGRRLLLLHGQGPPEETVALAESFALSKKYHAVLYGHTHRADLRYIDGVLLLNPGEACGCLTGRATIAVLDTSALKAEIVVVDNNPPEKMD